MRVEWAAGVAMRAVTVQVFGMTTMTTPVSSLVRALGISLIGYHVLGCSSAHVNPSFPVSRDDATRILGQLERNPKPLDRPLVIVGGLNDPGWGPSIERAHLGKCIDDQRVLCVVVAFEPNLDECREKLIRRVDEKFPGQQVDVIGLSLGGLVARYAAAPVADKPRLSVARLFTISSPHTGAMLAKMPTFDRKVVEMRPGSEFLAKLSECDTKRSYELIPYVRLGDEWVGASHAAPAGLNPWWIDTPPLEHAHIGASVDPRILADIALRLRHEPPLTHDPAAPLPGG